MGVMPPLRIWGLPGKCNYSPLPAPEATVAVRNEERLAVNVTFTVPAGALSLTGGSQPYTAEQTVRITCGG